MTTVAHNEKESVPTSDWDRVTVTGFAETNPAQLGFYTRLTLRNGTQRRCGQVARVVDERLIQRLRAEVKPGDEIRVSTAIDKNVPECPTVLLDFCPV